MKNSWIIQNDHHFTVTQMQQGKMKKYKKRRLSIFHLYEVYLNNNI